MDEDLRGVWLVQYHLAQDTLPACLPCALGLEHVSHPLTFVWEVLDTQKFIPKTDTFQTWDSSQCPHSKNLFKGPVLASTSVSLSTPPQLSSCNVIVKGNYVLAKIRHFALISTPVQCRRMLST